jgi:hypothetical protein
MVFARIASMMFTTLRLVLLEWNQNKKGVPREGTPFWLSVGQNPMVPKHFPTQSAHVQLQPVWTPCSQLRNFKDQWFCLLGQIPPKSVVSNR